MTTNVRSSENRLLSIGFVASLCLTPLFAGCTKPDIHGVWEIADSGTGPYSFGHYAYLKDGRKCTLLFDVSGNRVETTAFLNKWELNNGIITLTYGPSNSSIREGYYSRSRIDKLTDTELKYTIIESSYAVSTVEHTIRLPGADPNRVCAAVNGVLNTTESGSKKPQSTPAYTAKE